jgi:tRNA pseudouridine55 synthase
MISGLLNINKPAGITSHDVVAQIRKLAGQHKVGHAGTLDPLATGVLLVFLGQATRLIEYVMGSPKQYRATICFGVSTNTLDTEGEITATTDASPLTETHLRQLLPQFTGNIKQIPPQYAAIKQSGRPLYKLARAGQTVNVPPRPITINSLTWVLWEPPHLTLDVVCSAGTYIRSLARDLGDAAGTGAHLTQLVRTASGPWTLDNAVNLSQLENDTGWKKYLHPLDEAIIHLPRVNLTKTDAINIGFGRKIELDAPDQQNLVAAYTPGGDFLAILTRVESDDKLWKPKKVFLPDPAS